MNARRWHGTEEAMSGAHHQSLTLSPQVGNAIGTLTSLLKLLERKSSHLDAQSVNDITEVCEKCELLNVVRITCVRTTQCITVTSCAVTA